MAKWGSLEPWSPKHVAMTTAPWSLSQLGVRTKILSLELILCCFNFFFHLSYYHKWWTLASFALPTLYSRFDTT